MLSIKQKMLIATSVVCLALPLIAPAVSAAPLTKFVDDLAQHAKEFETIQKRLTDVSTPEKFKLTGEKLLSQTEALRRTLHKFVNAQTRRGTKKEFALIQKSVNSMQESTVYMLVLCEKEPAELIKPPKIRDVLIKEVLRDLVEKELAKRGLEALAGVKSLKDAGNKIVAEIFRRGRQEFRQGAQDVIERLIGMRFFDIPSARKALKNRLRQPLKRVIEKISIKLFGKVSSPGVLLVISVFEKKIYPKLREWLRPKGNVHNRTKRSVATMKESINELASLGKNTSPDLVNLKKVQRALNRAQWRIEASRYLVGDLPKPEVVLPTKWREWKDQSWKSKLKQIKMELPKLGEEDKATKQQLSNWFNLERQRLMRNIHITKHRFMLANLDEVEKASEDEKWVGFCADILRKLLNSDCFEEEVIGDTDTFGIEHEE